MSSAQDATSHDSVSDVAAADAPGDASTAAPGIAPLSAIVLDCPEPVALAQFYAAMLGVDVADGSDGEWAWLDMAPPVLTFQRVAAYEPPDWPEGAPQQVHLDFEVTSFQSAHGRVVALGATPLDPTTPPAEGDRSFRVYADPAGHPFCLCGCATTDAARPQEGFGSPRSVGSTISPTDDAAGYTHRR